MPHHTALVRENSTTCFKVWKDENLGARCVLEGGITFGSTDNKRALGTHTSINISRITKSMLGCSVANKTVFSSTVEETIVPILSTSSSCAAANTYCVGSTISSSSCTKVEVTYVGTCKSCTYIVALRIDGSTLLSLVCEASELLVSF